MFRAGLVGILLFCTFCVNVALCSPAPSAPTSLEYASKLDKDSGQTTRDVNIITDLAINELSFSRAEELAYSVSGGRGEYHEQLVPRSFEEDDDEVVVLYRRNIFSKIKHAFQKLGQGIKHVAQKIGSGIKHAAETVAHGVVHAAKAVAHGVTTAAKKVGHFVKTTGAKIAKFGLKVIATAQAVAAHVVRFIPVVGTAASAALKASSTGLNAASDAIHVSLGKKLDKGMKVMNIIQDPIGAAAHAAAHKAASKLHH